TNAPPGSRVFFTNSGTEANEAAFKMARRVPLFGTNPLLRGSESQGDSGGSQPPHQTNQPTRQRILALENAFHGRTMGALALTHNPKYREPFEPLPAGVEFLPVASSPDPLAYLRAAFDPNLPPVAALFLEPIQGEAGVLPLPPGYLQLARELTQQTGALLVFDEIQTGMGRTGTWLAHQNPELSGSTPVQPDVITLAKGLGGGFPIGAVVALGPHAASLLGRGQHGTTFGGNPVSAAAALAVISEIENQQLLDQVSKVGESLRDAIADATNPAVSEVRGHGLLIAVQLTSPIAAEVADAALDLGLIVNPVTPSTIRLAPPLILSEVQAKEMASILDAAIHKVSGSGPC
ncbi:MAG: aminotransferase class III-fold pyridoxal phosphate-dependent enzyme, partial [Promicromonosporaceae bacterium]|nr:aminotransferase class III-fold pyridoxal phosphate-dependent enzyme [Promicromonosporaceae bacterium]